MLHHATRELWLLSACKTLTTGPCFSYKVSSRLQIMNLVVPTLKFRKIMQNEALIGFESHEPERSQHQDNRAVLG